MISKKVDTMDMINIKINGRAAGDYQEGFCAAC